MEQKHLYLLAVCPECKQRACLTQTVDYATSKVACIVCPDALQDQIKCLQSCCHGCECSQNAECLDTECECDCHLVELEVIKVDQEMEIDDRCSCYVCIHNAPIYEEYQPGYDGGEGYWISNRPRECRHFWKRGHNIISTYYDNDDGRNHRLERFFPTD